VSSLAEASKGRDAVQHYRESFRDVTLMDLRLPDMSGIDDMIAIRSEFPEARIIILMTFAATRRYDEFSSPELGRKY